MRLPGCNRIPVVLILMPEDPSEEAFFVQVLKAVGAPIDLSRRRHRLGLRETSFRFLREIGTRMLMIDEINSILVGSARQQRQFLQLLRFLSNELQVAIVCAGVPEARFALLSDPQLRSRVADIALEPWTAGPELQDFVTGWFKACRFDSPPRSTARSCGACSSTRSGGITLSICRALERAGAAAIRNGQERIDLSALEDPAIWRGIKPAADPSGATASFGACPHSGVADGVPRLPLAPPACLTRRFRPGWRGSPHDTTSPQKG